MFKFGLAKTSQFFCLTGVFTTLLVLFSAFLFVFTLFYFVCIFLKIISGNRLAKKLNEGLALESSVLTRSLY